MSAETGNKKIETVAKIKNFSCVNDLHRRKKTSIQSSSKLIDRTNDHVLVEKSLFRPCSLFYSQLIQTVLLSTQDASIAKFPMLDQCIQYFSSSDYHLKIIYRFA